MRAPFSCSCWGDFLGTASLVAMGVLTTRLTKVGGRRRRLDNVRREGLRWPLKWLLSVGSQFFLPPDRVSIRTATSIAPANVTFTLLTIYGPDFPTEYRNARSERQTHCRTKCDRSCRESHPAVYYFSSSRGFRTGSRCITQPAGPDPVVLVTHVFLESSHRFSSGPFVQERTGNSCRPILNYRCTHVRLCETVDRVSGE